jgi:hypothetical protein
MANIEKMVCYWQFPRERGMQYYVGLPGEALELVRRQRKQGKNVVSGGKGRQTQGKQLRISYFEYFQWALRCLSCLVHDPGVIRAGE